MQERVTQASFLFPTFYSVYINDSTQTAGVYLAVLVDDTCVYATERKEIYVLRNLQLGLNSNEMWCKRWNNKIN
jgi:hypothetical protein